VTEAPDGGFLVVYDSNVPDAIGWACSADGIQWGEGRRLKMHSTAGEWAQDVRTPLGLVHSGAGSDGTLDSCQLARMSRSEPTTRHMSSNPMPGQPPANVE
jgi:hypothetical protein